MVCYVWLGIQDIAVSTWLSLWSLALGEASRHVWGHSVSLWRGPHGEELRPPNICQRNLLVMWLSHLGSWPSSPSDSFTATSWMTLNWTNQLSHSQIPDPQKRHVYCYCFNLLHFGLILNTGIDDNNGKQQISKCWRKIISNIFLYSTKFCTHQLSMKMESRVSCMSGYLKLSSLVPFLRRLL